MHFNPRSLAGATLGICKRCLPRCNFNPRSLAGATHTAGACITFQRISIHAPSRERPTAIRVMAAPQLHFNPRSLAGATKRLYSSLLSLRISIHAPSRERRNITVNVGSGGGDFNPRSLTGATSLVHYISTSFNDFNPRSLTGATLAFFARTWGNYISIHAPLRERHICTPRGLVILAISIHAPLRERRINLIEYQHQILFQSTLPYGSDAELVLGQIRPGVISIHAPLRERRLRQSSPTCH